jgi:hypothetical protein
MSETPPDIYHVAATIAQRLGETQRAPKAQIWRTVRQLGPEAAMRWLEKTEALAAQGGLTTADGKPRTKGGIFFRIVKDGISPKDRAAIFFVNGQRQQRGAPRPPGGPAQPQKPPKPAPALIEIGSLPNLTGEARVKITLIGRPGPLVAKPEFILTTMQVAKTPSLPKGLPAPPTTPTSYTVYIARKQWQTVAEALRDPEDVLIVEGFPAYDPTLEGVGVYATNVTTKALQQAKRAVQQVGT